MLSEEEKVAIVRSWRLALPIAETVADLFYRRLFELRPEYKRLFASDLAQQKKKLLKMLAFIVRAMDWADASWRDTVVPDEDLMLVVLALGRRHADLYKIPDESYEVVGEALMWTLDYGLGEAFTPELKTAWLKLYGVLSRTMKMGSTLINRDAAIASRDRALAAGEAALTAQQMRAGIDDPSSPPQSGRTRHAGS